MEEQSVGQIWPASFSFNEEKIMQIHKNLKMCSDYHANIEFITMSLINETQVISWRDKEVQNILCYAIYEWCIEVTDFAQSVLCAEDFQKAKDVYKRKQFDAGVMKSLLSKFYVAFIKDNDKTIIEALKLILSRTLSIELSKLKEERVVKTFGPLKKKIDEITSGVKFDCFLQSNLMYVRPGKLPIELHEYLISKYGYDFIERQQNWSFSLYCNESIYDIDKSLRKWLFAGFENWNAEQQANFSIINFIENVCKFNSCKHAQKILDYIVSQIFEDSFAKAVFEKQGIVVSQTAKQVVKSIEERTAGFTFQRFENKLTREISDEEMSYFSYPIFNAGKYANEIAEGKEIFENLLKYLYDNNYKQVSGLFNNLDNVINQGTTLGQKSVDVTIANMFDMIAFYAVPCQTDVEIATILHKDFFAHENVWARVYLKCHLTKKLMPNQVNECLFEVFYDVFKSIEKKCKIRTSLQLDKSVREEKYKLLCELLGKYSIDITSSKSKDEFIIALLDRKMATVEEAAKFSELEQLGDSIFDLAIAELIFYNPDFYYNDEVNKIGLEKIKETLRSARIQVEIAKLIGLNNCYISVGKDKVSYKFDYEEEEFVLSQNKDKDVKNKYIADSLEMVIGVIGKEFGYQKAVDFSKQIICKYEEKLGKQIKQPDVRKMYEMTKDKIDRDYFSIIYPAPFLPMAIYNDYITGASKFYHLIWSSLDKLLLCAFIGTETKENRNRIAYSYGSFNLLGDANAEVSPIIYDYFHNGLEYTISKYKDIEI